MVGPTRNHPKKGNFLWRTMQAILMLVGLVTVAYLLYVNVKPAKDIAVDVPPVSQTTRDTQGLSSARVVLDQATVNQILADFVKSLPDNDLDLSLKWEAKEVKAAFRIDFQGMRVGASLTALPEVRDRQLFLTFKQVNIGGIPIPVDEVYQNIAGQIALPAGFNFLPDRPEIRIDVNQLAGFSDPNVLEAEAVKTDPQELVLRAYFAPNQAILN